MACVDIVSAAGTKFYIAPAAEMPTTFDDNVTTGWPSVTGWEEVGEISSIGEYGKDIAVVTHKNLAGTVCKAKGSTNYGSAQISMALVPEDDGQTLLKTAVGSKLSFPCKVVYNDATATLVVPSVDYFAGLFTSFKKNPGSDPDAVIMATVNLELNSEVFEDLRSAT